MMNNRCQQQFEFRPLSRSRRICTSTSSSNVISPTRRHFDPKYLPALRQRIPNRSQHIFSSPAPFRLYKFNHLPRTSQTRTHKLPTIASILRRLFGSSVSPEAMSAAKTKAQGIIDDNAVGKCCLSLVGPASFHDRRGQKLKHLSI